MVREETEVMGSRAKVYQVSEICMRTRGIICMQGNESHSEYRFGISPGWLPRDRIPGARLDARGGPHASGLRHRDR